MVHTFLYNILARSKQKRKTRQHPCGSTSFHSGGIITAGQFKQLALRGAIWHFKISSPVDLGTVRNQRGELRLWYQAKIHGDPVNQRYVVTKNGVERH